MTDRILSFQFKQTREKITDRGGLAIIDEFIQSLGIRKQIEIEYPRPGSNRGIMPYEYIRTLIYHFIDGGRHLEDIRDIKEDEGFRKLLDIKTIPGPDSMGDWLRRQGSLGRENYLQRIADRTVGSYLHSGRVHDYTLDIDSTLIESDKGDGQRSYNGTVGYHPVLSYLSDGTDQPICSVLKFRQGNESPQADILESLKKTLGILKFNRKSLKFFRSDSAGYQSKIINYCQGHGIRYTITADFDSSVIEDIGRIPSRAWQPIRDREGIQTDYEYAETTHLMNSGNHSFRLIVKRKRNRQIDLFDTISYSNYYAVITNIPEEEMDGAEVLYHHQQRGNCERFIKDGKYGLNLQYVPCGTIEANRIYYTIGMIAYNIMKLFQLLILPAKYSTCLIETIRRKVLQIVGRVVNTSRQLWMAVNQTLERIKEYTQIRMIIANLRYG